MDSSTGEECEEIASAVGGNEEVCAKSGSIAIERFTGPQIRKFLKVDLEGYAGTRVIHLVSSFMASILAGESVAIDHGDGAGMNLMNLAAGDWDVDLVAATADRVWQISCLRCFRLRLFRERSLPTLWRSMVSVPIARR